MIYVQAITTWTIDANGNRSITLFADHQPDNNGNDITGQDAANLPPDPNIIVVEAYYQDADYQAILNDPNYGPGCILFSEAVMNDEP